MPATSDDTPKSKRLAVRVTPEERRKIKRLAEARERPYSDLIRELGVEEAVRQYDRTRKVLSEETS